MGEPTPSRELSLAIADTTLAAGLRYGRWVERAPSTEEQVAVSSMSQDKLGQARQFYQVIADAFDEDPISLQYDREVEAFAWNPAWLVPWTSWSHFVIAQVALGQALLEDLRSLAEGLRLREPLAKIEQEDSWHARHGSAWVAQSAEDEAIRAAMQQALDDLWAPIVSYFGAEGSQRFPDDVDAGILVDTDEDRRARLLDELVPQLEQAGLSVPAKRSDNGWSTDPTPSIELVEETRTAGQERALELTAMLQDPENRDLARI